MNVLFCCLKIFAFDVVNQCRAIWINFGDCVFIALTKLKETLSCFIIRLIRFDIVLLVGLNKFNLLLDGSIIFKKIFSKLLTKVARSLWRDLYTRWLARRSVAWCSELVEWIFRSTLCTCFRRTRLLSTYQTKILTILS